MAGNYKDLIVWQKGIDLVSKVYEVVRTFPEHEKYALTSQMRRAVVSIPSNVAEGQGRQHPKEFRQHLYTARGSLAELHTLLIVASRVGYIEHDTLIQLESELSNVRRPLTGLINRLS